MSSYNFHLPSEPSSEVMEEMQRIMLSGSPVYNYLEKIMNILDTIHEMIENGDHKKLLPHFSEINYHLSRIRCVWNGLSSPSQVYLNEEIYGSIASGYLILFDTLLEHIGEQLEDYETYYQGVDSICEVISSLLDLRYIVTSQRGVEKYIELMEKYFNKLIVTASSIPLASRNDDSLPENIKYHLDIDFG